MGMFSRGGSSSALACDELYLQPKLPHAHVAADLRYLPASINTDSHVRVIDAHRACEGNNENLAPFFKNGWTLFHLCERLCLLKKNCYAFDYYQKTKFCSFWEKPCKHPLTTKDGASSYEVTTKGCPQAGSGDGMMGILGNPTKYVCNAVQTVLAHLSNASNVTFQTTLVSESDRRFWHFAQPAKSQRRASEESIIQDDKNRLRTSNTTHKYQNPNNKRNLAPWSREPRKTHAQYAKDYAVKRNARPGNRCAKVKREFGDDVLTLVGIVPISPLDFNRRHYLRRYLRNQQKYLVARHYYRQIKTQFTSKAQYLLKMYPALAKTFKSQSHLNYSSYRWKWLRKKFAARVPDRRAVCIQVIFAVDIPIFFPV